MSRRLLTAMLLALPHLLLGQALPPKLKAALETDLKATPDQVKTLEQGGIVAYLVDQQDPEEIVLIGAARIWTTPERFVEAYRDIQKFESAPGVLAGAKFSATPDENDLLGLRLAKDEVDDLLDCKPGDCDFKASDRALNELRSKINRSAPDYVDQTNRLVRQIWADYIRRYKKSGNSVLTVYHDTPKYASVQKNLENLIQHSAFLRGFAPELMTYLSSYPTKELPGSEEFFYWQVGDFGLKPVHRASHVVIAKTDSQFGTAYVVASKMLFASHYFRSGLEVRYVIPGQEQHKGGMHYLITVQRSYVDGLTGVKGRMLRPIVLKKSRDSMERYIGSAKDRLERRSK